VAPDMGVGGICKFGDNVSFDKCYLINVSF